MKVHYKNVFKYSMKVFKKDQYMCAHVVSKHGINAQDIILKVLM